MKTTSRPGIKESAMSLAFVWVRGKEEEGGSEGGTGGDHMRLTEHFVSVISLKVYHFHPSPRNHNYVSMQLFYQ